MSWIKRVIDKLPHVFHVWDVTEGCYDQFGITPLGKAPTKRVCRICGKKERLEIICLGLCPPEYHSYYVDEQ